MTENYLFAKENNKLQSTSVSYSKHKDSSDKGLGTLLKKSFSSLEM